MLRLLFKLRPPCAGQVRKRKKFIKACFTARLPFASQGEKPCPPEKTATADSSSSLAKKRSGLARNDNVVADRFVQVAPFGASG